MFRFSKYEQERQLMGKSGGNLMRKLWILAIAALLLVALAAPSFAAETTITGSYRIRNVLDYNYSKDAKGLALPAFGIPTGEDLNTNYFDQRFRLTITHTRSEFLKAVVSIDLVEDMWGQQRNFKSNVTSGYPSNGYINTAYIQAITKIGLFKFGVDNQGGRFGMGTWSDSGMMAGVKGNPGITWGMKVDNFIATISYVKYVDFIDTIIDNAKGAPAGTINVWPGEQIGGDGSIFRDADVDTYVLTAHYVTDSVKVGLLYQLIRDPFGIGAAYLVNGMCDFGSFAGEAAGYMPLNGTAFASTDIYWPAPAGEMAGFNGFGRAGMYDAWLHVVAMYYNIALMDGKLVFKGEYDRIWGTGDLTGRGNAFNAALLGTAVPGLGTFYRLPSDIKVDGHTIYADLSYDFDVANVGVAFLYGSGARHWRPYNQHHFNFNTTGNDDFHWGNIIVPGDAALLGSGDAPLGLGSNPENVTSVKLYWGFDPIEKLNIHGAFIWAKYTQPVGRYAWKGDGAGSMAELGATLTGSQAFYGHPMNYANGSGSFPDFLPANVSDDLGWEIDLGMTYQIMEGLTLNSEFGVLFTGDAFDYLTSASFANPAAPISRHDWGNIYRWTNTLSYEF